MSDDAPRSAYEIAMERLRARDREAGIEQTGPLSDEQKRRIADARAEGKAKLAELEILHRKVVADAAGDPQEIAEAEERYRIDRSRVEERTESRVARIKTGGAGEDG